MYTSDRERLRFDWHYTGTHLSNHHRSVLVRGEPAPLRGLCRHPRHRNSPRLHNRGYIQAIVGRV